jgi:ankyrin repeat protein
MPTKPISARTSLEGLKKEAKRWRKELRAGDAAARQRFEAAHPRAPVTPGLRDVQHALAREHGLPSWADLRQAIDDALVASRGHDERVAEFLDLACLHYGVAPGARAYSQYPESPFRRRRAARILERHPEVGPASLHTAAVCGDLAAIERLLAARPAAVHEPAGREGWTPLLFLCYGRLPVPAAADNAVAIARLLLDHGADPDSHWSCEWEGTTMVWSALCGVIGNGEGGPENCPPHPAADPLAALLLDRGADVRQDQALYNTMLRADDDHWLRVLTARGLRPHPNPWNPEQEMFDYLLDHAVEMSHVARAAVLLEHGARANPPPVKGRTLHERALLAGSVAMAELLARHGAPRATLTGREAFRAACLSLDRDAARRLLAGHPEYLEEGPAMLVDEAAKRDLVEVARFLLELGVSPDAPLPGAEASHRALHQAAIMNHTRIARFLIEQGADVDARDQSFQATPLGWAIYTGMSASIALLSRHTRDVFTLVAGGLTERLAVLLAEDPARANQLLTAHVGLGLIGCDPGETPLFALGGDEDSALEVAELLLSSGAVPTHRNPAGETAADRARARGLPEVAEFLAGEQAEGARADM